MKRLAVLAFVLLVGVSLAQAQGGSAWGRDRRGGRGPAAVQAMHGRNQMRSTPDSVQRPMRQRLGDPYNRQATDSQPVRRRLRDPASCARFSPAGRGNQAGMGWGGMRGGGGRVSWNTLCCPYCGYRGGQGGWRHGWGR
jgi:hypothetical protein